MGEAAALFDVCFEVYRSGIVGRFDVGFCWEVWVVVGMKYIFVSTFVFFL